MLSRGIHTTRRLAALAAGAALAAASVFVVAAPAAAHDELIGSSPAADATVDALPSDLELLFSADIATDEGASEIQVTDAAGTDLADGAPTVEGNTLTQPLAGPASGAVTVLWKVVSSDGHPISGEFSFIVEGAPTPTPTETATPTPTETAAPVETEAPTATPTAIAPDEADSTFGDVWPWVLFGLLAAGIGGAVLYLLLSRARRERELDEARRGAAGTASRPGSEPPADQ